jgi:hypothetical protein
LSASILIPVSGVFEWADQSGLSRLEKTELDGAPVVHGHHVLGDGGEVLAAFAIIVKV